MVLYGLRLALLRALGRSVLTVVLLFPLAVLHAQPDPDPIAGTMPEDYLPQLREILKGALRSPDLVAREFDRIVHEAKVTEARSRQLPGLSAGFNYGMTQTATAANTDSQTRDSGFFYNVGFGQALFYWGEIKNSVDSARINLLITNKSYAIAYRELSVLLRKIYLALIVEKARLLQARESRRLVAQDVAIAEVKKDQGVLSGAGLAAEQLRLREADLDLGRAEADFLASRVRFARLTGMGEITEEQIPNEIPKPSYAAPVATMLTATLLRDNASNTLEYEIYNLRIRDAILAQKIAAVRLLPKFGLSAGYSLTNTTNVNGNVAETKAVTQQSVGIGGSWTIFDGLATRGVKREALAQRRAAEYQLKTRVQETTQTAQALERTLKFDAGQMELSDIRRGTAAEAQKLVDDESKLGHAPLGDVERARLAVMIADVRNFEIRAAYLGHWSDFVAITGNDPVLNNLPASYVRAKK